MRLRTITNTSLFVGLATLFASSSLMAGGMLGKRYASALYDFTSSESDRYDDGSGFSLVYNQPITDNVDIGGRYRYTAYDGARSDVGDVKQGILEVTGTAYGPRERDTLFVRVGFGFGHIDRGDSSGAGVAGSAYVGTEYTVSDSVTLTPYAGAGAVWENDFEEYIEYGLRLDFDVGDSFAVGVRLGGDEDFNVTASIGLLARF